METARQLFKKTLIFFIRFYQCAVSSCLGYHCRFYPSCSEYMLEAIRTYGILHGLTRGFKRLMRCHPLCKGGVDLLPKEKMIHD